MVKYPQSQIWGKIVDPHAAGGQRCTQGTEKYHVVYTKPIQSDTLMETCPRHTCRHLLSQRLTSTVRQACCQLCPGMTPTETLLQKDRHSREIHMDLLCHVTMTQKCLVRHTTRTCHKDNGTIRHAPSEEDLYCPRNERP